MTISEKIEWYGKFFEYYPELATLALIGLLTIVCLVGYGVNNLYFKYIYRYNPDDFKRDYWIERER